MSGTNKETRQRENGGSFLKELLEKRTFCSIPWQVLAATQTPGEEGKRWFQGTADAVRQFHWLFEVTDVHI